MERRNFETKLELRRKGEANIIRGYAAVFNKESEDLGGFIEIIAPGFFDSVLDNDVRALKNHDSNYILGRTQAGTLRIGVDNEGLWYEYDDPQTSYSEDLNRSIERKDITQSSFGFTIAEDNWDTINGRTVRTLLKARSLLDVSPVTYPAYPDTSVAKRSYEAFLSTSPTQDILDMDLELMSKEIQRVEARHDLLRMEREVGKHETQSNQKFFSRAV